MNILSSRHADILRGPMQASAKLPVELCELVLQVADLSADELVRCARSLSKAPNPLSVAAQSLSVWRPWHPQAVLNTYLEVCNRQPDYLVTAFLERHRDYSSDLRGSLRYYRNNLWSRPPDLDVGKFINPPGSPEPIDWQLYSFEENIRFNLSLPRHRIGQDSTPQAFDTAMALLRHRPDSEHVYEDKLPASLCAEPEFLRQALAVRPAWLSQAELRYKVDPHFQQVAFGAVLERLRGPNPRYHHDCFPDIPAEFFADLPAMRTAVTYDKRLFRRAAEDVRSDAEFLRAYRGDLALP